MSNQFPDWMLLDRESVEDYPEVELSIDMDASGSPASSLRANGSVQGLYQTVRHRQLPVGRWSDTWQCVACAVRFRRGWLIEKMRADSATPHTLRFRRGRSRSLCDSPFGGLCDRSPVERLTLRPRWASERRAMMRARARRPSTRSRSCSSLSTRCVFTFVRLPAGTAPRTALRSAVAGRVFPIQRP